MENWKRIFKQFLGDDYESLKTTEWMIMGSIATALQGCNVVPNDLDIIMKSKEGVYLLARLLDKYSLDDSCEEVDPQNEDWLSTKVIPVLEDEYDETKDCWTFGRWYIEGFKIECANIIPSENYLKNKKQTDGIWEGGPEIWKFKKYVNFEGYQVPVVPLEIQLETNLNRNLTNRINEIMKIFNTQSYDKELLNYSLSQKNKIKLEDKGVINESYY